MGTVTRCLCWVKLRSRGHLAARELIFQKQTSADTMRRSATGHFRTHALPQTASLFDHLIGPRDEVGRNRKADGLCCLKIDNQFELYRLLNRQVAGLRSV